MALPSLTQAQITESFTAEFFEDTILPGSVSMVLTDHEGTVITPFTDLEVPGQALNLASFHEYLDTLHSGEIGNQCIRQAVDGKLFRAGSARMVGNQLLTQVDECQTLRSDEEIAHDYLWRIHKQTPRNGQITIFNRSHYEDVLVVRVHDLVPETVWEKRYEHIRHFEQILADEGTTILKFFLNISKEEQKERFLERIEIPEKQWKFNPRDIEERKLWKNYMNTYADALGKTSTSYAPWYVIPANRNWYRNYVIMSILVDKLKSLKMKYPKPVENIKKFATTIK